MPRLRFRLLPVDIEVTDEQAAAARAVGDVVSEVARSELPSTVARAFHATRQAIQSSRRRRRARSR